MRRETRDQPRGARTRRPPDGAASAGTGEDDEPRLVMEPLDERGRRWLERFARRGERWGERWTGDAVPLGLAVVLLLAVTLAALRGVGGGSPAMVTVAQQSGRALAVPDPRVATPTAALETGWTTAGPAYARRIAFAPSAPRTAYVCGTTRSGASGRAGPVRAEPVVVSVSGDGGLTWGPDHLTPAQAVGCDLTVDPTDARDVVMVTTPCTHCSLREPLAIFRSRDGGAHWTAAALPARDASGASDFESYEWAWSGGTLYLAPFANGEGALTRLAASVAGRPFAWVETAGLYVGSPAGTSISAMLGTRTALYVVLRRSSDCGHSCYPVMWTRDGGAHWTRLDAVVAGQPLALLAAGQGGTLYAEPLTPLGTDGQAHEPEQRRYYYSTDGGARWQALAPGWPGVFAAYLLPAPDGTVYAPLVRDPTPTTGEVAEEGVYGVAPGDTFWHFSAHFPAGNVDRLVLAWDAEGHPASLWGPAVSPVSSDGRAGLATHAAT